MSRTFIRNTAAGLLIAAVGGTGACVVSTASELRAHEVQHVRDDVVLDIIDEKISTHIKEDRESTAELQRQLRDVQKGLARIEGRLSDGD